MTATTNEREAMMDRLALISEKFQWLRAELPTAREQELMAQYPNAPRERLLRRIANEQVSDAVAAALTASIARAKREIIADVRAGTVPKTCKSYSQLHDYVDANGYGGAFDDAPPAAVEDVDFWNAMQTRINHWINEGGLRAI